MLLCSFYADVLRVVSAEIVAEKMRLVSDFKPNSASFLRFPENDKNLDYSVPILYNFVGGDTVEKRSAKIIISAAGGNAGKNSKTYKLTIPSTWIAALGITKDSREVELTFDGDRITVERPLDMYEFALRRFDKDHEIKTLLFYNRQTLCTRICADYTDKTLRVENHTDNLVKTAFGRNTKPTWDDFMEFLEERCVPRERAGIREYLEALGLDEYDPMEIVKRTQGRMAEDEQWIEVREE